MNLTGAELIAIAVVATITFCLGELYGSHKLKMTSLACGLLVMVAFVLFENLR